MARGLGPAYRRSLILWVRMFRSFFSVGGLTALSRLTGFAREVMIGALMGAGPVADADFVALRLPNQFRAIFGEGAFNSAYVPTYSRVLVRHGDATVFVKRHHVSVRTPEQLTAEHDFATHLRAGGLPPSALWAGRGRAGRRQARTACRSLLTGT